MSKPTWLAIIMMSGQLSACTGWRVEDLSPADVIAERHPGELRVQRRDGRSEVLYSPAVNGDSLVGRRSWSSKQPDRALALADVTGVATHRISAGRTAALVVGVGAVVGVVVALGSMQGTFDNWGQ